MLLISKRCVLIVCAKRHGNECLVCGRYSTRDEILGSIMWRKKGEMSKGSVKLEIEIKEMEDF